MKNMIFMLFVLIAFGCTEQEEKEPVEGMRPIYMEYNDVRYESSGPQEFEDLSNIVEVGRYIMMAESGKGIHVIDNADPTQPKNVLFWSIPGCERFTLRNTNLYVSDGPNLLFFDISDPVNLSYSGKVSNVFSNFTEKYRPPSEYTGPFECVDLSNGLIVGWERTLLDNPLCRAY